MPLIRLAKGAKGIQPTPADVAYNQDALAEGMLVLYVNSKAREDECPFRIGRVLRLCEDRKGPYSMVDSWWPAIDAGNGRLDVFAQWSPCSTPLQKGKRSKTRSETNAVVVRGDALIAWPVELEEFDEASGGMLPFHVLHYIRAQYGIDVSQQHYSFSERGKRFYMDSVQHAAELLRSRQKKP